MKRTRDETPQIGEDQSIPGSPCSSVGTQTVKALKFDRNELPEISKEDAFRTFRLRRIVRENHGGSINSCSFFNVRKDRNAGDASNIMATVGAAQVNFYDNEHCGDHLDIMSHFVVGGSGYPKGETERPTEELKTAAWMTSEDDLVLAVAGSAGNIHLLSLTQSKELSCWEAHPEGISHLEAHPSDPNLLLSVGSGYRVRLWHVDTKKPLCEYHVKAASAAFHPNGRSFLTTGIKGLVHDWEVPEEYIGMSDDEALKVEERIVGGHAGGDYTSSKETKPRCQAGPYTFHTQRIDCIRYVEDRVLSKSTDGKIVFWDPSTEEIVHSFHVKGSNNNNSCSFDVSSCRNYFCVGNNSGDVFIYSLLNGHLITVLEHPRSTKAVRSCAFTKDDRNVVYVGDDALIWRFDHIDEEIIQEWDGEDSEEV